MRIRFYGIDPGLKGALAIYLPKENILGVYDMPLTPVGVGGKCTVDGHALARLIGPADHQLAVLERVSARPGQGVTSMFNFGMGYGIVIGVLQALNVPIIYTPPGVWKSALGLSSDKDASRSKARLEFPDHTHYFQRVKDDGRAEAALLAKFGADRLKTRETEPI